jgi:hypothetical protein
MRLVKGDVNGQVHPAPQSRCGYLLAELHCAEIRAKLLQANLTAIGLVLKAGLVTPEQALLLLDGCGALRLVGTASPDEAAA